MTQIEQLQELARECGFESMGIAPAQELRVHKEVRDMCAAGKCHVYGKSWACPPACPTIEEYQEQFARFEQCLVVQTVGELEDDFDFEGMMEAEGTHKKRFLSLAEQGHALFDETGAASLFLSAGTCTLCKPCSYPDSPCRFSDKRMTSMEAAGLMVAEACGLAGIPYNHGPLTVAYSSCVLV